MNLRDILLLIFFLSLINPKTSFCEFFLLQKMIGNTLIIQLFSSSYLKMFQMVAMLTF